MNIREQSGSCMSLVFLFKVKRPEITESTRYCTTAHRCSVASTRWSASKKTGTTMRRKQQYGERERKKCSKLMAYETAPLKEKKKKTAESGNGNCCGETVAGRGYPFFFSFLFFLIITCRTSGRKREYIYTFDLTLPFIRTAHCHIEQNTHQRVYQPGSFFFGNSFPRLSQIIGSTGTSGDTSRSAFKMRWSRKETPCKERKTRVLGVYIYIPSHFTQRETFSWSLLSFFLLPRHIYIYISLCVYWIKKKKRGNGTERERDGNI